MLLGQVPALLKSYANELRALVAMLRLRLFETLTLLPPSSMESNYAALLRLLVSLFVALVRISWCCLRNNFVFHYQGTFSYTERKNNA